MNHTIMLTGVHGVGKGYLLSKMNYPSYSASELIRNYKNEVTDYHKVVADVGGNQNSLLIAINKLNLLGKKYILDGHFCLINQRKQIERVPQEFYISLSLGAVFVLHEKVDIIYERLLNRDKLKLDIELIGLLQQNEISYANEIASVLKVPIVESTGDEALDKLHRLITCVWGG